MTIASLDRVSKEMQLLFQRAGFLFNAPDLSAAQRQERDFYVDIFKMYHKTPERKREGLIKACMSFKDDTKGLFFKKFKVDLSRRTGIQLGELELLFNSTCNIQKLDLSFSSFSEEIFLSSLKYLKANSPNLSSLKLVGSMITTNGLKEVLNTFPFLKELYIENYEVAPLNKQKMLCDWIKNNPQLEQFCGISIDSMEGLNQLIEALPATLKGIQLGFWTAEPNPELVKVGMEKLAAKCKTLQKLDVSGDSSALSSNFENVSAQFPHLTYVKFQEIALESGSLLNVYKSWSSLRALNLYGTNLNDQDFYTLLMKFPTLKAIDIGFAPNLTSQGVAKALQDYAKINSCLHSISLPRNDEFKFCEEGIDPVILALKPFFPNLHSFNLSWNQINDESFAFITDNLKGSALKEFSVVMPSDSFKTKVKEATMLQGILNVGKNCPYVESLTLNGNIFVPAGYEMKKYFLAISEAFTGLKELDLCDFPMLTDYDITRPLLQMMDNNPCLKEMDVKNFLDENFVIELKKLRPQVGTTINVVFDSIK